MEILGILKELLTNTKGFLELFVSEHGTLIYGLLFLIIFCETGLVFLPLLPGDSLLFTAGIFASQGFFSIEVLLIGCILVFSVICSNDIIYYK